MVDYIVVGLGLAGIAFCEQLEAAGKSYVVISDDSQQSSVVAGGLYNPVILKRFTLAWDAKHQLTEAMPFYDALAEKLNAIIDVKVPVYRRFSNIEEQNGWFEAADKPGLSDFVIPKVHSYKNPNITSDYGFGEVADTGRIDTKKLLEHYTIFAAQKGVLRKETVAYSAFEISATEIRYKDLVAKHIVFAEGYGLANNPWFNYLPLQGTKGELLTIKAPNLKEEHVIKSAVFIIPLGNDLYRVGATYKWKDKTNTPTEEAKTELLEKLNTFLHCEYEVVSHVAGIRPTVADRRPLLGQHPVHKNMYVLNGFGSRGVMIAPMASKALFKNIACGEKLPSEIDIARFTKKHFKGN